MAWKKFWKTDTRRPLSSPPPTSDKAISRSSVEDTRIDYEVVIKLHYKEYTYRVRFDLSNGYLKLRRTIMDKLDILANDGAVAFGYMDVDYNFIPINKDKDLMVCKQYTDLHYKTNYLRFVAHDMKEDEGAIRKNYKSMEAVRKADVAAAKRLRNHAVDNIPPQDGPEPPNESPNSFQLVTIIEDEVATHTIDYAFKNGFDLLSRLIFTKFKATDKHYIADFDRNSSLTLIRDTADLNESYNWMDDNKNLVLYYFPKDNPRKAYQHYYQEANKRRRMHDMTAADAKKDPVPPPDYHTISDARREDGVRHFKIGWVSDTVPYYGFFKYNPHNGFLVFKDIVEKQYRRKLEHTLGYFDEDMDSISIETDEDLEECARAIKGSIIIFEVLNWQGIRKAQRLWSEELIKLQQGEGNNWGD